MERDVDKIMDRLAEAVADRIMDDRADASIMGWSDIYKGMLEALPARGVRAAVEAMIKARTRLDAAAKNYQGHSLAKTVLPEVAYELDHALRQLETGEATA